jgi:hypothetical protein
LEAIELPATLALLLGPDLGSAVFAKLKHLLRKVAARTVETVCTTIGELLGSFTLAECANYFKKSGYASI